MSHAQVFCKQNGAMTKMPSNCCCSQGVPDFEAGAQKLKKKMESGVVVPAKSVSVSTGLMSSAVVTREEFPPCGYFAPSVSVEEESRNIYTVLAEALNVEHTFLQKYVTETRPLLEKEKMARETAASSNEGGTGVTVYLKTDETKSAAVEKKQPTISSGDLPFFTVCNDTVLDLVIVVIQDANAQILTSQATYSREMRAASTSVDGSGSASILPGGVVSEASGSLSVARATENETENSFAAQMAFANKVDDKKYVIPGNSDEKQRKKVKFDTTVYMPVAATRNCEILIQNKEGMDVGLGKKNVSCGKRIVLTLDPNWQAETSMLTW